MDAISDLYQLSDILGDDIYKVANAIRTYHPVDAIIDHIVNDIENLTISDYENTISCLLDMSIDVILTASMGLTFSDEKSYVVYLQKTLENSGVSYVPYHKTSLFD